MPLKPMAITQVTTPNKYKREDSQIKSFSARQQHNSNLLQEDGDKHQTKPIFKIDFDSKNYEVGQEGNQYTKANKDELRKAQREYNEHLEAYQLRTTNQQENLQCKTLESL